MVIAIDLTSLSYHLTGIERYAMCMTDKMIDLDTNNKYVLLFRNKIPDLFTDRIDGERIRVEILRGNNKLIFMQIILCGALYKIKADRYIFFAFPSPILFNKRGIINTIHDMGPWDLSNEMTRLGKIYFRVSYRHAAKISNKIITVSYFSKSRIHKILDVEEEKIKVIYNAVYEGINNKKIKPFSIIKSKYGIPEKYILTLSTIEPRKNLKILLDAFDGVVDKVDYDLVLVGRKGWKVDKLIKRYETNQRIHITGFVEDDDLSSIYKKSICFVFPSLYEGFGLPPVEALSLNVPVISSAAASLPEILMSQVVYFDNENIEQLQDILFSIEEEIKNIPHELNQFQKENYSFISSAKKMLEEL